MVSNSNSKSGSKGSVIVAIIVIIVLIYALGSCIENNHICEIPGCNKTATERLEGKRYCKQHAGTLWMLTH